MSKIKFEIVEQELDEENKFKKAKIRYHESDTDSATNEIPLIMGTVAVSKAEEKRGFPYNFPIILD